MTCGRRIQFEGNDADYIQFLEARVLHLENIFLRSSPHQDRGRNNHFTGIQGDLSQANHMCGVAEGSRRQISESSSSIQEEGLGDETRLAFSGRRASQDDSNTGGSTFEIIEFRPSYDINLNSKKRTRDTPGQGAKGQLQILSSFTSFVRNLPQSSTWKKWISVCDPKRAALLRGLVQGFAPSDEPKVMLNKTSKCTTISILHEYVALTAVESKDDVYESMREVFGSDAYSKRFEALIRGAKWVNKAISLLSQTRWDLRSWDIFLVGYTYTKVESHRALFNDAFQPSYRPEEFSWSTGTDLSDISAVENQHTTRASRPIATAGATTDGEYQRTSNQFQGRPTPGVPQSENEFDGLFRNMPSLPGSIDGQAHPVDPEPGEPTTVGDNLEMNNPWLNTYLNPQPSRSAPRIGSFGRGEAWFSTYPNPHLSEAGSLGTSDVWFSTYPNPQLGESAPQGGSFGTGEAWFSTYLNPHLGEAGSLGTSDVWFSTYPNPQLGESTPQGGGFGTGEAWFSTYQNS
ncbi:uncharacterized protein N7506_001813 [Penicillium brevicompactum]|uniref:uncharacterized protein n=1 Tax=Penicillium brevicompactum TaxID=5074 RepID=UPI002541427D|nr:uncharacterized protein N7506_001813 [Penicillium brevicompactum]KAJ5348560.1 hypothetical protein N7506_001813 [Penicillium brevicompactum]